VRATDKYATAPDLKDGGKVTGSKIMVKIQEPAAPKNEVSFPDVVFDKRVSSIR